MIHFATFSIATTIMLLANMLTGVVFDNTGILSLMLVCAVCTLFCNVTLYYVTNDFGNMLTIFGVLCIVFIGGRLFGWHLSLLDFVSSALLTVGLILVNYELNSQTAKKMNQQLQALKEVEMEKEKTDELK